MSPFRTGAAGKKAAGSSSLPGATLYMFTSDKSTGLNAFAATRSGAALPEKFAPWTLTGEVLPGRAPPFSLPRKAIEEGIAKVGYQLWRHRTPETKDAAAKDAATKA